MAIRDIKFVAKGSYKTSRGLIIGIDDYLHASNLGYAVSDAKAIYDLLISDFSFEKENLVLLKDKKASRIAILKAFAKFANDETDLDDRIIIFFAGHGHTITGLRGDQGFLVPYDGDACDISTLISWRELTSLADLVRAKHMLFIMDACYSGLALTRNAQGSQRFVHDMMKRYSRQVLTAGKADEIVSDSGGPMANHSVFTGHLIEGLTGKALDESGVMAASSLMAYVYKNVANDKDSIQTPHYGHFDGDGDFILRSPSISVKEEVGHDEDTLFSIPYVDIDPVSDDLAGRIALTKEFLSDDSNTIKLHDFVIEEVKWFITQITDARFLNTTEYSEEDFINRTSAYEEAVTRLSSIAANIAFWVKPTQYPIIEKLFTQSVNSVGMAEGNTLLTSLRWHPFFILTYMAGIAAIEGRNYGALKNIFYAPSPKLDPYTPDLMFAERLSQGSTEISRVQTYNRLPGHEKFFVPMSEYLYKAIQPKLDDLLYIGPTYERTFDEFEILWAMVVEDLKSNHDKFNVYAYIGRFGWKGREGNSPLSQVLALASDLRDEWPPIKAGLFGGDPTRAISSAERVTEYVKSRSYS